MTSWQQDKILSLHDGLKDHNSDNREINNVSSISTVRVLYMGSLQASMARLLISPQSCWCLVRNLWKLQTPGQRNGAKMEVPKATILQMDTGQIEFFSSNMSPADECCWDRVLKNITWPVGYIYADSFFPVGLQLQMCEWLSVLLQQQLCCTLWML